jgi:hypothetical protein
MNTQRLLGHGRALSIDRAAAAGASPRTKHQPSTTTTTPTTPASASATMVFRGPPVVHREESEARAKAAPPPPKVITGSRGLVHQLASWWVISIRADLLFFFASNFIFFPVGGGFF